MSYTKTQWNNDTAPAINETNLNKIEQGIYDNDSHIGDLSDLETTANTDLVSAINENVDNIGDLTTLTTTAKADLVSAVNELDSDKLEKAGGTISGGLTVSGDITNKSFDLFNDTSGADWKAFLKNKIDYCIANINTTKSVTSMFINGGWAGVTYGNGIFTKIYNVYTLTWFGDKGTYFCFKEGTNYQYKVLGNNNCHNYEEVIGTWTNGKPLYRTTIEYTGPFSSNFQITHNLSISQLVNYYGTLYANGMKEFPTMYVADMASFGGGIYQCEGNVAEVTLGSVISTWATKLTIVMEYTKSTD